MPHKLKNCVNKYKYNDKKPINQGFFIEYTYNVSTG